MPPSDDAFPGPVDVHCLLGNHRRRLVIGYLALCGPGASVEVRHLARIVQALETEKRPASVTTAEYESAYNSLIQTHLPQLAAAELIDYDDRGKVVTVNDLVTQYALVAALTRHIMP